MKGVYLTFVSSSDGQRKLVPRVEEHVRRSLCTLKKPVGVLVVAQTSGDSTRAQRNGRLGAGEGLRAQSNGREGELFPGEDAVKGCRGHENLLTRTILRMFLFQIRKIRAMSPELLSDLFKN